MLARFLYFFTVVVLVALLALAGCTSSGNIDIEFDDRSEDIPPVRQSNDPTGTNTIKIAISAVISPAETLKTYQELLTFLGDYLGKEIMLIQKPTYAEVNDLLKASSVDMAFICSLAYVAGKEDFGMELLAAPNVRGRTVYFSYLIVPKDSDAKSLEDLKGTAFAFTDPMSNSGRLAPTYQLSLMDETPDSFFGGHVFTYSHDNSIRAVADGLVDGAAVDSLVYDYMTTTNPELESGTKVIATWGPYGMPPVVVNPEIDNSLKKQLRSFLLNLAATSRGRQILNSLEIDHFEVVDDAIYDSIREMLDQLGW